MKPENLTTLLHYQGIINGPIIAELLDDLDFKCINDDVPDVKRKKIFNIAVEMFQNVYHYSRDLKLNNLSESEAQIISLSFKTNEVFYILETSNLLKNEDEPSLKDKINQVNERDKEALRSYYRLVLTNEEFSDKGGAGLGFIDMKKRSGNNLEYKIESINKDYKKYTLIVKVNK